MIPNAYDVIRQSLLLLMPEFLILLAAIVMMTAGAFVRLPAKTWAAASFGTMAVALLILLTQKGPGPDPYSAVVLNDPMAWYGRLAFVLTGLLILALSHGQVDDSRAPEFLGALLLVFAGSMVVAAANELVLLFVGLELVSIPTYLLLYLPRRTTTTQEAATKYFFLSIFSSSLLLFGLAYVYGLAGVSNLKALSFLLHDQPRLLQPAFGVFALIFVMAGLGFRAAAVPFHFYAPDVYQGSPTIMAAVLAWFPKGIGFLAMLRVLTAVLGGTGYVSSKGVVLAWIIAVATMTLGNTVALLQENLKRLFAYSSIAHAGYLMIGVTAAFRNDPTTLGTFLGAQGVLFYLAAYALMTLGAFGIIIALSTPERAVETVNDFSGLAKSHPFWALAMALCLFSLAGVPPLAGFWGKFYLFASLFSASTGTDTGLFTLLAVIAALNAAIGAYYYLRIVVLMYLRPEPDEPLRPRPALSHAVAVGVCAGLSLLFGLYPRPIAEPARRAALASIALPGPEMGPVPVASIPAPEVPRP